VNDKANYNPQYTCFTAVCCTHRAELLNNSECSVGLESDKQHNACTCCCRNKQQLVPQALAGGDAGSIGGDKGNWGSGGGGGSGGDGSGGKGGEGSGEGGQQPKKKGWAWKGWTDRVAADPEFPFKVLLEQVSRVALVLDVGHVPRSSCGGLTPCTFAVPCLPRGDCDQACLAEAVILRWQLAEQGCCVSKHCYTSAHAAAAMVVQCTAAWCVLAAAWNFRPYLQVIGVGASVIGDMSSRPNWGLNELDFVFATLVVSCSAETTQLLEMGTAPGTPAGVCWQTA
jgi:hypothetical protein